MPSSVLPRHRNRQNSIFNIRKDLIRSNPTEGHFLRDRTLGWEPLGQLSHSLTSEYWMTEDNRTARPRQWDYNFKQTLAWNPRAPSQSTILHTLPLKSEAGPTQKTGWWWWKNRSPRLQPGTISQKVLLRFTPNSIRQLTPNPPPKPSINKLTNKNLEMQALCGHLQNFNLSLSLERSALSREGTLSLPWAQEGTKTQKQLQLPYKPKVLYPLDIFTTDIM